MKAPRFEIGARVVSPSGSLLTVIGNEITSKGVTTSVEYAGRTSYPEEELEHADPVSLAAITTLNAAVIAANQRASEAEATARAKAKPAKKRAR